jgi:putative transposase
VLDCHDRECLAALAVPRDFTAREIQHLMIDAVAQRFGAGRPDAPVQFLSDNGSIYTALDTLCTAERLHLEPITTPEASPESNGMSEAFVNTLKRDYVSGADRCNAATLLDQASAWMADYNAIAPHSALGYRSPQQYRTEVLELA